MAETIYWIGDSTVQTNRMDTYPQCGMGQVLELFLRPEVRVCNHAKNGQSTLSFQAEGRFEPVEQQMSPGDFLLIQFGHNDEKTEKPLCGVSPEQYAENLLAYARSAQRHGAQPVLITPLVRRKFENGLLLPTHTAYTEAARALSEREHLALIDLTVASRNLVQTVGEVVSRKFYMNFGPGQYPLYPDGMCDDTHLRYEGAVQFDALVAEGLLHLGGIYARLLLPEWVEQQRMKNKVK